MRASGVAIGCFIIGALTASAGTYWWARGRSPDAALVRDALLRDPEILAGHPEILAAAQSIVRSREQNDRAAVRRQLIGGKWARLTHPAFAPTLGNPNGDAVLIEFTDYGCEPCRASAPAVEAVLESMPQIRVVVLLLPTSGAVSEFAARVGYTAWLQSPAKFAQFNRLMLSASGGLTTQSILRCATEAGLDVEQLQQDANSSEVRAHLAQVKQLAGDLNVIGVPAFVADGRLLSGGVSAAQLDAFARSIPHALTAGNGANPVRPDFVLVDQSGQPRTMAAFRDRWLLVYFGFTRCPDVCPTSLMRLAQALRTLGDQAHAITPALITVDPEHDSPEVLARYVKAFGSTFVGLTGSRAQISAALESFGAYSEPAEDPQAMPSHSATFYLVDPRGNLSRRMSAELSASQIARYLRNSVAQPTSTGADRMTTAG